jgi:hypothetical protein
MGDKAVICKDAKDCIPQTAELRSLLSGQRQWQADKKKCDS